MRGLWSRARRWIQASPLWGPILAYFATLGAAYAVIWAAIEPMGVPDIPPGLPPPLRSRLFYHLVASVLVASHLVLVALWVRGWRTRPRSPTHEPAPVGPDEHRRLKERVQELEAALQTKLSLRFEAPVYYAEGGSTPYCAVCWEHSQRPIHLVRRSFVRGTEYWDCRVCKQTFGIKQTGRP